MSSSSVAMLTINMVAQWFAAAASIWLTWWASQSRDPVALRGIAMALVVIPALVWPALSLMITTDVGSSMASRAFLFAAFGAGIALVRALFLVVWAIVSNDPSYLRIVGVVAALLLVLGPMLQFLSGPFLAGVMR